MKKLLAFALFFLLLHSVSLAGLFEPENRLTITDYRFLRDQINFQNDFDRAINRRETMRKFRLVGEVGAGIILLSGISTMINGFIDGNYSSVVAGELTAITGCVMWWYIDTYFW